MNNINNINTLLSEVNELVNKNIVEPNKKKPEVAIAEVVGQLETVVRTTSSRLQASMENSEKLRSEIATKTLETSTLERQIRELESQHATALEAAKSGSSSKIANLESSHKEALNARNRNKQNMKAELNNRISVIEEQLEDKRIQLEELEEKKLQLESEKEDLSNTIKEYKSNLLKAVESIKRLKTKISNYNKSYQELQEKITEIYTKYSSTNGELLTNENSIIEKAGGILVKQSPIEPSVEEVVQQTGEPKLGGAKKRKSKSIKLTKSKKSVKSKKHAKKRV